MLLGAAVLAAGLATSLADNVYSVNVVGYVNFPTTVKLTYQSNPLDASGGNVGTNVIPNSGTWDTCEIQIWTGTKYQVSVFDSSTDDTSTGFTDRGGNAIPAPALTNGMSYFFNNLSGVSNNITYVGTVRTGTNYITLPYSPHLSGVASAIPLGGGISSVLELTNNGSLDTCEIQIPRINAAGNISQFQVYVFDSSTDDTSTGFTDRGGNAVPEPVIQPAGGFIFNNLSGSPQVWTQILNVTNN